jgi:hypothetical protein
VNVGRQRGRWCQQGLVGLALLIAGSVHAAPGEALPADVRLDPVRAELGATIDQAARAGLPADALYAKVKEGLAKGVAAARILAVVKTLATDYGEARAFAQQAAATAHVPTPSTATPTLWRALVDARAAGLAWPPLAQLTAQAAAGSEGATRAIQAAGDLAVRGYPTEPALAVVRVALARDPQSLPRLGGELDRLRRAHGLTYTETALAVADELAHPDGAKAGGLDRAAQHVDEASTRQGAGATGGGAGGSGGDDHGRGPHRDGSGSHGKGH